MRTKSHFPCYKSYLFQVPGLLDEIEGNLLCPKISSPNVVESPLVKVQCSVALESSIWRNLELSKKNSLLSKFLLLFCEMCRSNPFHGTYHHHYHKGQISFDVPYSALYLFGWNKTQTFG